MSQAASAKFSRPGFRVDEKKEVVHVEFNAESNAEWIERVKTFFSVADEKDIIILQKFYFTGEAFPSDTTPYCFPILVEELNILGMKWHTETLRKRLNKMAGYGIIQKTGSRNPSMFTPVRGDGIQIVRNFIKDRSQVLYGSIEKIFNSP